jgi:GDP/UDP-N,N'-diacetylbacillosamine 2-epimerase (hydrolysing)
MIDNYIEKNITTTAAYTSMGQLKYLSTLQFVDAVMGNSSSGIIEAPSFKIGTINIGSRQEGRVMPNSIISCDYSDLSIAKAFNKLYSNEFQNLLKNVTNPYGDGNAANRIINVLRQINMKTLNKKQFYDIQN